MRGKGKFTNFFCLNGKPGRGVADFGVITWIMIAAQIGKRLGLVGDQTYGLIH